MQAAGGPCKPTAARVCVLSNPSLRELPPELGQLGNLWQLDIEDLSISNVPAEIRKEGRPSSASPPWGDESSPAGRGLGRKRPAPVFGRTP